MRPASGRGREARPEGPTTCGCRTGTRPTRPTPGTTACYDADFLATHPARPGRSGARPRAAVRRLHPHRGRPRARRRGGRPRSPARPAGRGPRPAPGPTSRSSRGRSSTSTGCFPDDDAFDGVISRAAMQWVPMADHPGYLAQVRRLLRPGGWFRLEMGGAGNIRHAGRLDRARSRWPTAARRHRGRSPTPGPTSTCSKRRASSSTRRPATTCARSPNAAPSTASRCSGGCAASATRASRSPCRPTHHAAFRAEVEARLDELRRPDGTFDQTYVRLDALATRRGCEAAGRSGSGATTPGSAADPGRRAAVATAQPTNWPMLKRPIMA